MNTWNMIFYPEDKDTFNKIKIGEKRIESRALTSPDNKKAYYGKIRVGDLINFDCEDESFVKRVKSVRKYSTYNDYLKNADLEEIHGKGTTIKKARDIHSSFEGYIERLEKYGIVTFELEPVEEKCLIN